MIFSRRTIEKCLDVIRDERKRQGAAAYRADVKFNRLEALDYAIIAIQDKLILPLTRGTDERQKSNGRRGKAT